MIALSPDGRAEVVFSEPGVGAHSIDWLPDGRMLIVPKNTDRGRAAAPGGRRLAGPARRPQRPALGLQRDRGRRPRQRLRQRRRLRLPRLPGEGHGRRHGHAAARATGLRARLHRADHPPTGGPGRWPATSRSPTAWSSHRTAVR
ncbi:hypothetical protein ACFSTC_28815 [Nonomuraea ferruginea]